MSRGWCEVEIAMSRSQPGTTGVVAAERIGLAMTAAPGTQRGADPHRSLHMTNTSPMLRALPLAGLFLLSITNACVIITGGDDGGDGGSDDDGCVDLSQVCPNLACEFGNVVVDGCEICECQEACVPGPPPECASPVFLDEECRWVCGNGGCIADEDCGPGFTCVFDGGRSGGGSSGQDTPDGRGDVAAPPPLGVCIPVEPIGCRADEECGEGFFCDFSVGVADGAAPDRDNDGEEPGDSGDAQAPSPEPRGQCRPLPPECFSDLDCPDGQVCQFPDFANGLVAIGGVCIDAPPVSECASDDQCPDGLVCEVQCLPDPSCPMCDACFVFGTCVEPARPCFVNEDCREGEFCDAVTSAARRPCLDADGDGQCDDAVDPLPAGVCRVIDPCADVVCPAGTVCSADSGEATCVAMPTMCRGTEECADGLVCNAADVCLPPPDCDPMGGPCAAVCYGFCVEPAVTCFTQEDCADDEVCVFAGVTGPNRPLIAPPSGTCQPAPGGCDSNEECVDGQVCVDGACVEGPVDACANVRCRGGFACQLDAAGNADCVELPVCSSTSECAEGTTCSVELGDCNSAPGCVDGQECPALCYGYCV